MTASTDLEIDLATAHSVQEEIRLPLPLVESNVDYAWLKRLLEDMDELLRKSGVEDRFISSAIRNETHARGAVPSERRAARMQKFARRSLRCNIARLLSEESFRAFSVHLADSVKC